CRPRDFDAVLLPLICQRWLTVGGDGESHVRSGRNCLRERLSGNAGRERREIGSDGFLPVHRNYCGVIRPREIAAPTFKTPARSGRGGERHSGTGGKLIAGGVALNCP